MKLNGFSSLSGDMMLRNWTDELRRDMAKTQYEVMNGRHYDLSSELGHKIGELTDISVKIKTYEDYKSSNTLANYKLQALQDSFKMLFAKDAKSKGAFDQYMDSLLSVKNMNDKNSAMGAASDMAFNTLVSVLNSSVKGEYLFGGTNKFQIPFDVDKFKKNLAEVYKKLNIQEDKPITKDKIQELLKSKDFNKMFTDEGWKEFCHASKERSQMTISDSGENVDTSSTAQAEVFRSLMRSVAVTQIFKGKKLDKEATQLLADETLKLLANQSSCITPEEERLAVGQMRIKQVNNFFEVQTNILKKMDCDLASVDIEQAMVIQQNLETALSMSYQLTSRLSKLSLINYL